MARYDTLANHYETIFTMVQEHKWAWGDIQSMFPFERDIYVILLKQWVDAKNDAAKQSA